jgi:coenzyme PQQ synthesis protein D (PqqD)
MAARKPKMRGDLALVEIDEEALVYDHESEGVNYLNASAKLVLQLCDGTATVAQTASQIAEAVEAPLETVQRDVREAVSSLWDLGLLMRETGATAVPPASGEPAERRSPIRLDVQPGPCTEKVDKLAWPVEQSYELGPYELGVRTNSERFGAWLEDTLSEYRSSERIGALYSVLIPEAGSRQRENVLYRESLVLAKTLDLAELVQTLRFELESFLFAQWDQAILLETAIVSTDDNCALVPSLTASELSRDRRRSERAGMSAPPGGRMAIDPNLGRLVAVPSQLRVLDDALGGLVGVERARQVRSSSAADGLPAFDVVCLPSPLTETQFESISRAVAVLTLADLVPNLPRLGARALEGLALFIERVPCYRLTSRPESTLDALAAAMRSHSADAEIAR